MTMGEMLVAELQQEAVATRRVLERVPMEHIAWRPHPTARSLGELAMHIATTPAGLAAMALSPSPMQAPSPRPEPEPTSTEELMAVFETSLATASAAVRPVTDATLAEVWRMMHGEREIMAMPRGQLLRSAMLNHWYHHRGQLSVYLRQLGVPIPSIYGPSGDENTFA